MRYKFRYLNGVYKTVAAVAGPMQNFFITIAVFIFSYYLVGRLTVLIGIDNSFMNSTFNSIVREIMIYIALIFAVAYCFLKKGVFLYNDRLVIARYTITPLNWKSRIIVNYNEIEYVNVNYTDLHFTKYRFSVINICADEAYNVELTLKNGKKYFFSIQNQEEFCDNLNSLLIKYNEKCD